MIRLGRQWTDGVLGGAIGSRGGLQGAHPDQVVCRCGEEELPIDARTTAMAELPQPTNGLRLESVTYVLGIIRHPCDRNIP